MAEPVVPTDATRTINLSDYDEIAEVLKSRHFVMGGDLKGYALFHDSLVTLDGDAHAQRRRLEAKLFGRECLAYYKRKGLLPTAQGVLDQLRALKDDDGVVRVDLAPLMWHLAHQVPALLVGIDVDERPETVDRFVSDIKAMSIGTGADWQRTNRDEFLQAGYEARRRFAAEFFHPSLERRRQRLSNPGSCDGPEDSRVIDLISLLLLHGGAGWDEDALLRECVFFLTAAIATTALSFPHLVAHLEHWIREHPEDEARVTDLDFLQAAVDESLRFFVLAPARLRRATRDVVLASGRRIAAGEECALWFRPANLSDRAFGPDADQFNPHREVDRRSRWGLAFGGGVHMCLGKPLVTGFSTRRDEPEDGASHGTMAALAKELFHAGLESDATRQPVLDGSHYSNLYSSFPVCFTKL